MTSCVQDPGSLRALAKQISDGSLLSVTLTERCIDRIAEVQPLAEPWREVDATHALEQARLRDHQAGQGETLGPLHGIPVGIKDIIDVAGLPTRCNNRARQDCAPASADAEVVRQLKAAGAIVLGKVHTTEFAYFDPSPACNPHNVSHTPGGSSSGSGSAVASGTVPLAVGTQTVASVIRPAAYCGIAAFKPSTGSTVTHGVSALAPSFDTIGLYGWSVDDAVYAYDAVYSTRQSDGTRDAALPEIHFVDDPLLRECSPALSVALEAELARLTGLGCEVRRAPSPVPMIRLGELNMLVMEFETARAQAKLLELPSDALGARLREAIERGRRVKDEDYLALRAEIRNLRDTFYSAYHPDAVFFWPAAPGPAPEGLSSTGDPRFISPWTVLGGPMIAVPTEGRQTGMPLGCFLAARPGDDGRLGAVARQLYPERQVVVS